MDILCGTVPRATHQRRYDSVQESALRGHARGCDVGLLMTPGESSAQRGGRGGRGGNWGGSRGWSGGWGGYGWDGGRGNYGGYGYSPGYYGYRYYDMPDYYSSQPSYATPSYYYTPATTGEEQEASDAANRALVQVRVPDNAEVFFEGEKTNQPGSPRRFISPPLQPGKTFTYDIRARWTDNSGKPVEKTQQVKVQAGRRSMVDGQGPARQQERASSAETAVMTIHSH